MSSVAISVEGLWKSFRIYHERNQYLKSSLLRGQRSKYEEFWALKDVSFDVPVGSTFGIVGSNGSGKSTLLKCLTGILNPDKGRIAVAGKTSALLELGAGFHPDLTGRENVFLNGAILGMSNREIERNFEEIVDFSGVRQFIDTPIKNYSSGMIVRLGFSIAINTNPDILIIDEVLAVGDASFQQRCYEKIEEFRKDGRTIILVSHSLEQITRLCSSAIWIEKSGVKEVGDPFAITAHYSGLTHQSRPALQPAQGERWGTAEIEITEVAIVDFEGRESTVITTGKRFSIEICYRNHKKVQHAVCGVRISHLHGMNLWGTNTKRQKKFDTQLSDTGVYSVDFPAMPLLAGTYELTVAISDDSETLTYDHLEKCIRFEVAQGDCYDEGLIDFQSNWTHRVSTIAPSEDEVI